MTGIVQKIHAARGTVVRKEQPLASLDARELELDIRQGKDEMELRCAELQRAEALAGEDPQCRRPRRAPGQSRGGDAPSYSCRSRRNHETVVCRCVNGSRYGSRRVTRVPPPTVLSISTLPPCSSTTLFTIASPSPTPPQAADRARSTR